MAETNHASFIPKNSSQPVRRVRGTRRIYLLSYLSYVIFFGTLLATLGVFFYSVQVSNALKTAQENLDEQRNRFSQEQIDGIRQLEKRIIVAEDLLEDLTAPSAIFASIEAIIAENVQLTGFAYNAGENGLYDVKLTGKANSLNPILYQRELLQQSDIFRGAVVSEFDYAASEAEDSEGDSGAGADGSAEERDEAAAALIESLLGDNPPVVTFDFTTQNSFDSIPYVPVPPETPATTDSPDSEVISVRSGEDSTADNQTEGQ